MASAVASGKSVSGRVDRSGRLIEADAELAAVQRDAGGTSGGPLALPQLAIITRLAFRLGVTIERPAVLATEGSDIHCWVCARLDGDEALLTLDNWTSSPARGPRFAALAADSGIALAQRPGELLWTSDSDLKVSDLSPALADLLGVTSEEAVGMPLTKLLRLNENSDGDMPLIDALAERSDFTGQKARSRADPTVELVIEGSAALDPAGNFAGFRGRARQIGAAPASGAEPGPDAADDAPGAGTRRPMDSTLEEVLRLPIERIVAEGEKIAARSDGPLRGDYAGYGGDIVAAARHLLSVLGAMGDEPEYGRGQIDLAALAAEAVVLVEPIAESRQVAVTLDSAPPIRAAGEEHAVIQILVNLLVNAIRHSPPESTVRVGFATAGGQAQVSVADEGVGIAPEDHKRIFERFERADEQPGGTGLGLAIARRLARSMGGDVTLDSAPGKGARFTLGLPAA